jgi:MoaA/NifB/PqqE/SkfB family radical SAM enzyme
VSYEERIELFHGDPLERRFERSGVRESGRPALLDQVLQVLDAIDAGTCQRLVLAGGNPQDHPDFHRIVEHALERGLPAPSILCEARALADPASVERLRNVGIEQVVLAVGGARPRTHEAVLRDPGGFEPAMLGLRHAARSGLRVYILLPLIRTNARDAVRLIQSAVEHAKPNGVLLALPSIGDVAPGLRPALLRFREAAEIASRVFELCRRSGLEYGFAGGVGVAPCATSELDAFASVFHQRIRRLGRERAGLTRVDACATCSLEKACGGIERSYVGYFGQQEFSPVSIDRSMAWRLKRINSLEEHDYKNVSAFDNDAGDRGRSLLRVNGHCQMACSFCFVDRTVPDYDPGELEREISRFAEQQTDHLVLSGGEPTLHPELPRLIAYARGLGFRTVEIQTNGVKLENLDYGRSLVDAGLNKATVSLHSVEASHSDEITKLPGAFPKTVQGLGNLRTLGVTTQIAHVITKNNYRELPATVRFLREVFPEGAGHLSICFAIAQGISDLVYSWVIPTFTEIKPFMREALDFCLETNIGFGGMIGQGGYPPCMLDGNLAYYRDNLSNIYRSGDHGSQFQKAPRCRDCSFDPYCIGVRRDYVACFGDDEIQPFAVDGDELAGALPVGPGRAVAPHEGHMPRPDLVRLRRSARDS